MKQLFGAAVVAFSMYSRVPMPRVDWNRENMRYALCFFPLVGLAEGALCWLWLWLCPVWGVTDALRAAVLVTLPLLVTGGIHLDGFCDTADALASHQPPGRKLEIMKDPHIGAFALIACCAYLLLQYGLWSQYRFTPRSAAVLALGAMFARALSGLSVVAFPCAKKSGLAAAFSDAADRARVGAALIIEIWLLAFAMLSCSLFAGGSALVAAVGAMLYYKAMSAREFGGITGDLAGWFLQVCQLAMLAAVVVAGGMMP